MSETVRKPLSWFKDVPQIRQDLGSEEDLRNLGESLRVRQLSPIGAMSDGEVIYGFRRLRAAWIVGLPDVSVTIYNERLSKADIKIMQITENFHRLDMSPYEKWNAYEELRSLNPKWTAKDLADHLKIDPPAVTKWLSPSKCIPAWRDALKSGLVGISDCYYACQVPEEQQEGLLAMKLAGASRDALERAVREAKQPPIEDSSRSTRVAIPLPCGSKVVVSGSDLSLAKVVKILGECLNAAKDGMKGRQNTKAFQMVMRGKAQAGSEVDPHV